MSFVSMEDAVRNRTGAMGKRRPLRVLLVCLKYDYGDHRRGLSFENVNFLDTLLNMRGVECTFFPFDEILREKGRDAMNDALRRAIGKGAHDVCFFSLFTDEISPETIRWASGEGGAKTLGWFGDDHWRFRGFSRHWAPYFDWIATTDSEAVEKYRAIGCRQVIKTQWGFNHHRCKTLGSPPEFDVTFVGQVHSRRRRTVRLLRRAGIDVRCWGKGWNAGRLSQDDMIKMFSKSRINLNLVDSSVLFHWKPMAKVLLNRRADGSLRLNSPFRMAENLVVLFVDRRPQIKARTFEIPGSGGLLVTGHADNIEEYFVPDKEIVLFYSVHELIEKTRYYLAHSEQRELIRAAGEKRALRDHTFEHRFRTIFRAMGLLEKM